MKFKYLATVIATFTLATFSPAYLEEEAAEHISEREELDLDENIDYAVLASSNASFLISLPSYTAIPAINPVPASAFALQKCTKSEPTTCCGNKVSYDAQTKFDLQNVLLNKCKYLLPGCNENPKEGKCLDFGLKPLINP